MLILNLIMLLVCIGIPLICAWRVMRLDETSWAAWLLIVADAAVFVALVLLVGRWDMAGYYTRFLVLALFLAAVFWSATRHLGRPWQKQGLLFAGKHWTTLVSLVLFSAALCYVVFGMMPPPHMRPVEFPLVDGHFMVGQGGRVGLLNYHSGHREQSYAADITAINAFGVRAKGLAPKELQRYVIYGASVVSPCAGEVVGMRNDLPDLIPPETDGHNPPGNHVILDCGDFNIELAHFRRGSISVRPGDQLASGDVIGKVGNSGNTTEPHLHIHAVDPVTRTAIPISFEGRFPVRNRLLLN